MNNWRTVSEWMTEDEAWNELADLEMLGIHYNLEEREMGEWRVVSEWLPEWWAESLCQGAKAHFELLTRDLEEKMINISVCPDCGGYRMVSEPMKIHPSDGTADDCSSPCTCKPKDEEVERDIGEAVKEVREEYADYAKQEIRFCPYCGAALGMRE